MSSLVLVKGGNLKLDKSANLNEILVGLGWDQKKDTTVKEEFDLDVVALLVGVDDKGIKENDFFYYNHINQQGETSDHCYPDGVDVMNKAKDLLKSSVVVITKDNRTGAGEGDDETLFVNSSLLPKDKKLIIALNIYEASERKQVFGMINSSFVRIVLDGKEFCRYDLKEDFSIETGVIVGEFYWNNDEIKFRALGKGFNGTLQDLFNQHV